MPLNPGQGVLSTAPPAAATPVLPRRGVGNALVVGVIGLGIRGHELLEEVQAEPGVEVRWLCDLYDGNIRRAQGLCTNPDARVTREYREVLHDPAVDAVIIATPDFWHARMSIDAAQAHKDIYQEKALCRTLPEAKQIVQAVRDNDVVFQLGHQRRSAAYLFRAREIFQTGSLGQVSYIHAFRYHGGTVRQWQYYTDYDIQSAPADAGPETIDWERFIAQAPRRPFDVERFFTWRHWWDYGTGIAGDLMSHEIDGVNMITGMGIPESCAVQGGIYFWQDGRDVPDVWNASFNYPGRDLQVTFSCAFHNGHYGSGAHFFGREMTMEAGRGVRVFAERHTDRYRALQQAARDGATARGAEPGARPIAVPPVYVFDPEDGVPPTSHMRNFLTCVRSRALPRCHIGVAFEEAVTVVMSVVSYKEQRMVRWDPARQEIV